MNTITNTNIILFSLDITSAIFLTGFFGVFLNKRNLLLTLINIEFMYFAASTNFVLISYHIHSPLSMIYGVVIIFLTTIDTCFGLSLLFINYKQTKVNTVHNLLTLRG
jgi:NADH-quinone oxidoreductase subunit K